MKKIIGAAAFAFIIFSLSTGCSKEATFGLKDEISLGTTRLTVLHCERIELYGRSGLGVFMKWTGLGQGTFDSLTPAERAVLKSLFIKFNLTDSKGRNYRSMPIPEYYYRYATVYQTLAPNNADSAMAWMRQMQYDMQSIPEDWVLIFEAPPEASGLTLHFRNPFPEKNQPVRIAVDLER